MRSVIRIPFDKEKDDQHILILYEIMSIVVRKVMASVVIKIKKGNKLTNGDLITIYEVSKSIYTLIHQTNHFEFSGLDLMTTYMEYE